MRRLLCLLCVFACFCLAGCRSQELSQQELQFVFRCRAAVTSGELSFFCTVDRQGSGVISYETEQIGYHWTGNGFSQTCAGLEAKSDDCPLPQDCFAVRLNAFLEDASRPGSLTPAGEGSFTGSLKGEAYTVEEDPLTGRLRSLSVPGISLSVVFYASETE